MDTNEKEKIDGVLLALDGRKCICEKKYMVCCWKCDADLIEEYGVVETHPNRIDLNFWPREARETLYWRKKNLNQTTQFTDY